MSFTFGKAFQPFIEERPIAVMARGVLENLLHSEKIDELFERTAQVQYTRELAFSTVVDLMAQVVLGMQPSVHAAHQAQAEKIGVSNQAIYDKLNGIEPGVSAELVRSSARDAAALIKALRVKRTPLLAGYQTKILDGNHLSATEHRIEELRTTWAAPLPGKILVVLDQELGVASDVILCEDGHAQERSLLGEVLQNVGRKQLWIADRNFCTCDFMLGIAARQSRFIIRQHGQLKGKPIGPRKAKGKTSTGKVHEQKLRVTDSAGKTLTLRRITVTLNEPTRDGDTEIHLLTNLPASQASAKKVAQLYAERWTIETMFQEVTETLTCEINTLGYPKAALFGFCLALLAYHAVAVIKAAVRAAHGEEVAEQVSGYYLSLEISQTYDGMMVAVPPRHWKPFRTLTPAAMARILKQLAQRINLRRYQKHPRGPKKPPPEKSKYNNGGHVSTARLLATRT
jgi:predicted nucleic acid-binding Zn finger protein